MDFRCCARLIEYGSLWHGFDSPIIPLRYRLLRHHQVKYNPENTTLMAEIAIPIPILSCSSNFYILALLSMVLLLVLGVTYLSDASPFTSHSGVASLTRA